MDGSKGLLGRTGRPSCRRRRHPYPARLVVWSRARRRGLAGSSGRSSEWRRMPAPGWLAPNTRRDGLPGSAQAGRAGRGRPTGAPSEARPSPLSEKDQCGSPCPVGTVPYCTYVRPGAADKSLVTEIRVFLLLLLLFRTDSWVFEFQGEKRGTKFPSH